MRAMGTAARYDAYASWYDARLGRLTQEIATPILQVWLGTGPGVCLDLGCGGGVHLATVAALGWSVIGLDVSWRQLRIARERGRLDALVGSDAEPRPMDVPRGQAEAAAMPIDAPQRPSDATPPSAAAVPTPTDAALMPAGTTPTPTSAAAAPTPAAAAQPTPDAVLTMPDVVPLSAATTLPAGTTQTDPSADAPYPSDAAPQPAGSASPRRASVPGRAGATLLEGDAVVTQAGATALLPSGTVALVQADAARLPLADASVDAVVTAFIHSDVDDWASVLGEVGRVLRPGGRCISIGIHPCFVGPFSRRTGGGPPQLYPGYRQTTRTWRGPGLGPNGVWWRVGGQHVPLAALVNAFIQAGLAVEHLAEPGPEDFPRNLAIIARRPPAPQR